MSLVRCTVCGPPKSGKSSFVKRIISHRFDNLPTRNAEFMGLPADGRHVSLFSMPTTSLGAKVSKGGPSQVLLELQDQLDPSPAGALNEPTWWEVGQYGDTTRRADTGAGDQVSNFLEGLSPRSQLFAATSAAATKQATDDGGDELSTEHWAKKIDPRSGVAASGGSAAAADGGERGGLQMRSGMPPEAEQHPLMAHQFQAKAAESAKPLKKAEDGVSLTDSHGTHGWVLVFDLCSRRSFDVAKDMAKELLERVNWNRDAKVQCPIAILLVGNKYDLTHKGKRSGVSLYEVLELCASYTRKGFLLPQLRKQKIDRAIYRLCEKIISNRKAVEASIREAAGGKAKPGARPEDELVKVVNDDDDIKDVSDGAPRADPKLVGGVDDRQYRSLLKLKAELDPMALAKGGGQGCTDLDVLIGTFACIEHPLARKIESPSANEIFEALFACPAIAIKYVPVSCRTNHQIHLCERVLLRALKLLPTEDRKDRRRGTSADGTGPSGFLQGMSSGVTSFLSNPVECLRFRKQETQGPVAAPAK